MKISFYISDHGYGHATRSIALARALVAAAGDEPGGGPGGRALVLEILNHHAHALLRRALAGLPGVRVLDRTTDVGFLCREDRLAFDVGRTALAVWNWISGWKRFVAEEVERLRPSPPDLIISDAAPEPLLVAERLGIASIVVSNFTWVDQYEPHLRADLVAPLRGSYALALRAHAYAMRTGMGGMRNVVPAGLVTREPARGREEMRGRLGVGPDEPLVHLGFGWTADAAAFADGLDATELPAGVRFLVSANLAGNGSGARTGMADGAGTGSRTRTGTADGAGTGSRTRTGTAGSAGVAAGARTGVAAGSGARTGAAAGSGAGTRAASEEEAPARPSSQGQRGGEGHNGRLLVIPPFESEAHEYIAACDLVIAKAGYGTVAEAIAGRVPVLAVPVEGSVESEGIARAVSQLGIGAVYPPDEPLGTPLLHEGLRMLARAERFHDAYRRLPSEYAPGAAARLARAILAEPEQPPY